MRTGQKLYALGWVAIFFLTGCFAKVKTLPTAAEPVFASIEIEADVPLVGLSVSGGGSRAATFAAGALEALAGVAVPGERGDVSLLSKVTHISSVSGGSLASAYYAAKKPPKNVPVLDDRGLSEAYQQFFGAYKEAMQMNFQRRAFWRQVFNLRAFNPTKAAYSFSEVWDSNFFDDVTFSDLYAREASGDSPRLILNGTQYSDGRRFALTTLQATAFDYNFIQRLREAEPLFAGLDQLKVAQEHFRTLTMDAFRGDHRTLPLSLAVATSASFPPVVGPVTYRVADDDDYHHVGDGGLFDNLGLESLGHLFLKKLHQDTVRKGLILVVDASYPFAAGDAELRENKKGFTVFKNDPSRIVGIMEERAIAYQAALWGLLRKEDILLPDLDHFRIVTLKHTDYDWRGGYNDLPPECHNTFRPNVTPEKIRETVRTIPTKFKIDPCHGALLITAARKTVEQHKDEIVPFLAH